MSAAGPRPAQPTALAVAFAGLAIAFVAWVLALFATVLFSGLDPVAARALGLVAGYGAFGALAARAAPPFAGAPLGARGAPWVLWMPTLLLVPAVLLVSEVDNVVASVWPRPDSWAQQQTPAGLVLLQAVMLRALLEPILAEFFYRGVLQSGTAPVLGAARAIAWIALLEACADTGLAALFGDGAYVVATSFATTLCWGLLYGFVRSATGSLLASITLRTLATAAGFAASSLRDQLVIPGFNTAGDAHTPWIWLGPAALSVAIGLAWLARAERRRAGR